MIILSQHATRMPTDHHGGHGCEGILEERGDWTWLGGAVKSALEYDRGYSRWGTSVGFFE